MFGHFITNNWCLPYPYQELWFSRNILTLDQIIAYYYFHCHVTLEIKVHFAIGFPWIKQHWMGHWSSFTFTAKLMVSATLQQVLTQTTMIYCCLNKVKTCCRVHWHWRFHHECEAAWATHSALFDQRKFIVKWILILKACSSENSFY